MKKLLLSLTVTAACFGITAKAAISVGAGGSGTLTFDAFPTVADGWSTLPNGTSSGDIPDATTLDATVQTNVASAINMPLGSSATTTPSISSSSIARWNSALQVIQTVPTSVGYISLLATLRNDTGADQSALTLSYDLNELHGPDPSVAVVEEVPGHRVYFSLTGEPNSWQVMPEISSVGTPGTLLGTANLGSWPNGSLLYILWADDNAQADRNNTNNEEGGYAIDNITFTPGGGFTRAISVGPGGSGTFTFDTYPNIISGWSTLPNGTSADDIGDAGTLDVTVQTNVASAINRQLGRSLTITPSISSSPIARWNATLNLIQTVPTGVGYLSLLATLKNDTGSDQPTLTVTYNLGELNAPDTTVVEEVPDHRVYYSLTGEANSWQLIPSLSSVVNPGTLSATLSLGSWPNGSLLYILWADDNAQANRSDSNNEEGGYTLDNVSFTLGTFTGVRITTPTNGQSFPQGVPITIDAVASLAGNITDVSFYENGNLIGSDNASPFSVVYSNATLGAHDLTARASDDLGNSATSSMVRITIVANNLPTVNLTEPANGASFFVGLNVTNRAVASDTDGTVIRVEFYVDGSLFFTDSTSPYSFELCDITAGSHSVSAVAVDNGGFRGTNAVSITATNPPGITILIPNGSTWKYLDDGSDQSVFWRDPSFIDGGWSSGVAELGYGDATGNNRPERTVVSFGLDANAKFPTTYFRKTFAVADPSAFGNLVVRLLRDDGGIVYINGMEVLRSSITNEVVDFSTYTQPQAGDDGTVYQVTNASPALLVRGDNVVAVEIHQDAGNSSDISFDLMLWGEAPAAPSLIIRQVDPTHAEITWPSPPDDYVFESNMDLSTTNWNPVSDPDTISDGLHHVTVSTSGGMKFFRLRKP